MTFAEWIEKKHPESLNEDWKGLALAAGLGMGSVAHAGDAEQAYRKNAMYRIMMQHGHPGPIPAKFNREEDWRDLTAEDKKRIESGALRDMYSQFGGADGLTDAMTAREKEIERFRKNAMYRTMIQFGWRGSMPPEYRDAEKTAHMSDDEKREIEKEVLKSMRSQFGGFGGLMDSMR